MEEKHVVTNFLEFEGKILILRRSKKVGTYRGRWAGVSGYIEENVDKQAIIEINEETSLTEKDLTLIKKSEPVVVFDRQINRKWVVHPYRWQIKDPQKIKIDWEHTEIRWIEPSHLSRYLTVPGLKKAWEKVK